METNPPSSLTQDLLAIATGAGGELLERDNTFPIASTIAALDRAIGLCLIPEHVIELLERRASLEDSYEHTIDLCYAGKESIAHAAVAKDSPPQA